ncbi:MAG: aromatic ring-hydroxylating dioxygenase subunit alpha [Caulobacterales bacterium]
MADDQYVVGEYKAPPQGRGVPQERKSPPLSAFLPNKEDYLEVSPHRYFDPAHADLEWRQLWSKVWICAGRASDVAEKGAWFRFDFGRESFIVIRSADAEVRAFYNVCQHRANRLIDDDFGKKTAFVCPYHSWRFDSAGKCLRVTDQELFSQKALAGSLDIPNVRCETADGFVFINMDQNAKPLAEHLGEVTEIISGYRLDQMEIRADVILELDCNWKTILDAFSENYHVHITHAFAMPMTEDKIGQMDFYPGGHTRRIVAIGDPAARHGDVSVLHPSQAYFLQSAGIEPENYSGDAYGVRRAVQQGKRAMGGKAGEAYATLSDNQLTDDWAMNIFPNMHLSLHAEGGLMMRYYPHRSDPNRCSLHIMTLAHPGLPFEAYLPDAPKKEANGRPSRVRVRHDDPHVIEAIGQLLYEDIRNTREAQFGLQSNGFRKIRLSEHEQPIMFQNATMDRYLFGETRGQAGRDEP